MIDGGFEMYEKRILDLKAEIACLRAALDIARTGLLKIERQSEEARAALSRIVEQKEGDNADRS
jgi:hypothetical protein